jgi:cell division protein FtsB
LLQGEKLIRKMKSRKLRKPLYDEAMVRYSTRLRRDQVKVLQKLDNAAELVRSWIDKWLDNVLGDSEPILIDRKIKALEDEIKKLENVPDYVRSKAIAERGECYSAALKALEPETSGVVFDKSSFGERTLIIRDPSYDPSSSVEILDGRCAPGWTVGSLQQYLEENGVINGGNRFEDLIYVPKEHAVIILTRAIEAYPAEVKVAESYNAEIAKLETERQRLRQRIAELQ